MYVIYWTVYYGNKMPRNYIGFTSLEKHRSGYKGSVNSIEWKLIWKEELINNPDLFKSHIIEYVDGDVNKALEIERKWQKRYKVVESNLFINRSYSKGGFIGTKESAAKSVETRRLKGIKCWGEEANRKRKETKIRNGTWHTKLTKESIQKSLQTKLKNGTYSGNPDVIAKGLETRKKNGTMNTNSLEAVRKRQETKLSKYGTLNVQTPQVIAKSLETKRKNGTLNITTPETVAKGLKTKLEKYGTLNIWTPELLAKRSATRKGMVVWNNDKNIKFSKDCPGEGWNRGRLKRS